MTCKLVILALALAGGSFVVSELTINAFAGEITVSEATPALDWDLYHDRQDACREAARILAQCAQGHCDEFALRQAQRACQPGKHPLADRE
jgi:hypothetical protein